jgi:hypothetical protein
LKILLKGVASTVLAIANVSVTGSFLVGAGEAAAVDAAGVAAAGVGLLELVPPLPQAVSVIIAAMDVDSVTVFIFLIFCPPPLISLTGLIILQTLTYGPYKITTFYVQYSYIM